MTESALMGTILAVQHDSDRTVLRVATGGNGSKRQDNVVLPGRRESLTSGKAVKLTNFIRDEEGALVPGENAKVTITNLAAPTPAKTEPEVRPTPPTHQEEKPAKVAHAITPKPEQPAGGIMAFSDKATRQAVFNRAVDVAREFAEHIRKSGQIIKIQGRDYVTVAGWSLLPAFESANCYTVSHQIHTDGTIIAEAIVEKNGRMVSRGFGACSQQDRPKINDRLAMAQTRARGSALKARYSVLVTLAGYEASLADEVEEAVAVRTVAVREVTPVPTQQTAPPTSHSKPSKQQLEFALKMFDGDRQALLAAAADHGLLVFQVEDIFTSVLKQIVEKRVNDRKRQRADAAAHAA